jgi:general secretion pathway protein F/type IV pilus assembly protein PilC
MPLYRFEALSEKGRTTKGSIDAESLQDAKLKLVRRQIAVLKVEILSEAQVRTVLKKKDLYALTSEIARLLQAGLPLFESLSALEEKYRGQKEHTLLLDLCDQVRAGHPLSSALKRHPDSFDLLYVSMIANAEKTGSLREALEELATLLHRQMQVQKQLVSALLYPALLSGFCMVILSSLLFFVVPSLQELFEGKNLHPLTRVVFFCSHIACRYRWVLGGCLLLSVGGAVLFCLSSYGQEKWRQVVSRLPFFNKLLAKLSFVRFCRASATLLEGGLPIVTAFAQARGVMRHAVLEKVIANAEEKILEGQPLHIPFQNHPMIPPLVPRMIAIAGQGGQLSSMMRQIAEIYEEELETYLSRFAALAQPILLLILGGLVGFVLLAVLLPLTDVSSMVG